MFDPFEHLHISMKNLQSTVQVNIKKILLRERLRNLFKSIANVFSHKHSFHTRVIPPYQCNNVPH